MARRTRRQESTEPPIAAMRGVPAANGRPQCPKVLRSPIFGAFGAAHRAYLEAGGTLENAQAMAARPWARVRRAVVAAAMPDAGAPGEGSSPVPRIPAACLRKPPPRATGWRGRCSNRGRLANVALTSIAHNAPVGPSDRYLRCVESR